RTVRLSTRAKKKNGSLNKTRLPRFERDAHLEIRWGQVNLPKRAKLDYETDEISLNVVHVFEPCPPEGQQAIDWMLFTSEVAHSPRRRPSATRCSASLRSAGTSATTETLAGKCSAVGTHDLPRQKRSGASPAAAINLERRAILPGGLRSPFRPADLVPPFRAPP